MSFLRRKAAGAPFGQDRTAARGLYSGFQSDGCKTLILAPPPGTHPSQAGPPGPAVGAGSTVIVVSNRWPGGGDGGRCTQQPAANRGHRGRNPGWCCGGRPIQPRKFTPPFLRRKDPRTSNSQQKEGALFSGLLLVFNLSQPNGPVYSAEYPSPRYRYIL